MLWAIVNFLFPKIKSPLHTAGIFKMLLCFCKSCCTSQWAPLKPEKVICWFSITIPHHSPRNLGRYCTTLQSEKRFPSRLGYVGDTHPIVPEKQLLQIYGVCLVSALVHVAMLCSVEADVGCQSKLFGHWSSVLREALQDLRQSFFPPNYTLSDCVTPEKYY